MQKLCKQAVAFFLVFTIIFGLVPNYGRLVLLGSESSTDAAYNYLSYAAMQTTNNINVIYGTDGDDVINITTAHLNYYIFGLGGSDIITIAGGNNTIDPGSGSNIIYSGTGSDTYIISRGYGFNRITANSNRWSFTADRLVLKDGIRPDEIFFAREENN
jgi:Ca2+-binding RTX toxin-like protein